MLKVNVGLSRKLSRDYNSTGFSLNLEGEVGLNLDDPDAMIEKIKEFYDLADEALSQQIERYQSDSAIASRDEEPPPAAASTCERSSNGTGSGRPATAKAANRRNGKTAQASAEAATNKQIQYLLNIGKRQGLTPKQLENRIEQVFSRQIGVYELTKREAGEFIDILTQNGNGSSGR